MFTPTHLPIRPIEELRTTAYNDLNTAEINKLQSEDPEAYAAAIAAVDGAVTVTAPTEATPVVSAKRTYWRNGQLVEITEGQSFVNGIARP